MSLLTSTTHFKPRYQELKSDPASPDTWTQGGPNDRLGMAVGPVSALDGRLVIQAVGGGFTCANECLADGKPAGERVTSRIEFVNIAGTVRQHTLLILICTHPCTEHHFSK